MKALKTKQEYELMKSEMSMEIDNFLKKFDEFIRSTSPNYWRTTGSLYTKIKNFKDYELKNIEPLSKKDLEQEWVRDEVATEEEKKAAKYNL